MVQKKVKATAGKAKTKVKAKVKVKVAKVAAKPKLRSEAKSKAKGKMKTVKVAVKTNKTKPVNKKTKVVVVSPVKKVSRVSQSAVSGPMGVKPYNLKKGEEYMSQGQLDHFRSILLNWKKQLMQEVDRTKHHLQVDAANYPDPVDRASQEEEFNLELRTRDRERKLLRKIDAMINRIDEHDYGFCDDCGAEIGIRRLEARPTANQCVECKTIAEIREKQVGETV